MISRLFVERKEGLAQEAEALFKDAKFLLGVDKIEKVRIINRYDVENVSYEILERAKRTVFSEPQTDNITEELKIDSDFVFATEYLPGQFDQRADSASVCIQLMSRGERPVIKTAKIYEFIRRSNKKIPEFL